MTTTIVGYFENINEARAAERDLADAGIRGDVQVVGQSTDGMHMTEGSSHESWWDKVKDAFGFASERDLGYYQEATRRGGTLLSVRVPEEQTTQAAEILERHHPVDLDQRMEGWQQTNGTLQGLGTTPSATSRMDRDTEESIPLAEEELTVGKRAVARGALRVHTYVTEQPVEEQVTLREQQAFVDRRPVDRAATAGEAAFQERTIEVQEIGEEAVVSKQARVVEEVSLRKEQSARTETVRDTVRKTEVEVERDDKRPRR